MSKFIVHSEEANTQKVMTHLITNALFTLNKKAPGDDGTNYKPLYYGLYNGIFTIIENAHTYEEVITALKQLQSKAEDAYIEQAD